MLKLIFVHYCFYITGLLCAETNSCRPINISLSLHILCFSVMMCPSISVWKWMCSVTNWVARIQIQRVRPDGSRNASPTSPILWAVVLEKDCQARYVLAAKCTLKFSLELYCTPAHSFLPVLLINAFVAHFPLRHISSNFLCHFCLLCHFYLYF